MSGVCQKCSKNTVMSILPENCELKTKVTWNKWQDNDSGRPIITSIKESIESSAAILQEKLAKFKVHCFVKNIQSNAFEGKKACLLDKEALIQVGFAENYTCISQDEIQRAHWSNTLVTIFTCVAWFNNGGKKCFALVSDDLSHDKHCIWVFLRSIIGDLKENYGIEDVTVFSDGASSQFKNKYTLTNLCYFEKDFDVSGEWCFFATSHGKGAVDGVGGTVKRAVWEQVKSRQANVATAEEFYNVCKNVLKGIHSMFVPKTDIDKYRPYLEHRWKLCKAIPQIQSCHYFRASSLYKGTIVCGRTLQSQLHLYYVCLEEKSDESDVDDIDLFSSKTKSDTRVAYSDVYSSDNESDVTNDHITKFKCKDEVQKGQYLLVEQVAKGKKRLTHKYIVVTQGGVEENGEIEVFYLANTGSDKKKEIYSIGTQSYLIKYSEVVGLLEEPQAVQAGGRIYFKFSVKV